MWEKIEALIKAFLDIVPEAEYCIAHVQLSDYNLWDKDVADQIGVLQGFLSGELDKDHYMHRILTEAIAEERIDIQDIVATIALLQILYTIPEVWRTSYFAQYGPLSDEGDV